jgi:small-conductance mechanosensitive channel
MFFCSSVLRIVTPLQSISALFIADIGRYIGHTAAELQDIRSGLLILARGARLLLWLGAGVFIASSFGADPLVALSGFGAGTLFVGLALHKSVEDACAVVRRASLHSSTPIATPVITVSLCLARRARG